MYRLGVILESVDNVSQLEKLKKYYFSQREEYVEEDECPHWNIYEYHINDEDITDIMELLKNTVKETWYIHAFSDSDLYVVLKGKYFKLPLKRNRKWNDMIKYGTKVAKVKKNYLKNIPLHI